MRAAEFIAAQLEMTLGWALPLFDDLRDMPHVRVHPGNGPTAHWLLGHLALAEVGIFEGLVLGKPNRLEAWEPVFNMGTTASDDGAGYPPYEEAREVFASARAAAIEHARSMGDDDLDAKTALAESNPMLGTVGACLGLLGVHATFHVGQAADIRRAAGRAPLVA